jgi:hypothetical protein
MRYGNRVKKAKESFPHRSKFRLKRPLKEIRMSPLFDGVHDAIEVVDEADDGNSSRRSFARYTKPSISGDSGLARKLNRTSKKLNTR